MSRAVTGAVCAAACCRMPFKSSAGPRACRTPNRRPNVAAFPAAGARPASALLFSSAADPGVNPKERRDKQGSGGEIGDACVRAGAKASGAVKTAIRARHRSARAPQNIFFARRRMPPDRFVVDIILIIPILPFFIVSAGPGGLIALSIGQPWKRAANTARRNRPHLHCTTRWIIMTITIVSDLF